MDTKYFSKPFAVDGNQAVVPDAAQSDGTVSYDQGYGPFYALNPEADPDAILVERREFNNILFSITGSLAALQTDFPQFVGQADNDGSPFAYNAGAVVRFTDGQLWASTANNNITIPGSAGATWVVFLSQYATVAALAAETSRAVAAENLKAPLASPILTGNPQAPTQAPNTTGNLIATCAFVAGAVAFETARAEAAEALLAPTANPNFSGNARYNGETIATQAYADAGVAAERNRAIGAESLLAPVQSPGFSGTPTVPTPSLSDNSATIPNTSWVNGVLGQMSANGSGWYQVGPFIVQWDTVGCDQISQRITFPRAFPNACLKFICVEGNANDSTWGIGYPTLMAPGPLDAGGAEVWALIWQPSPEGWVGAAPGRPVTCSYIAVGF